MTEIIPAILETDWSEIEKKISLVKNFSNWVQLDVADGVFVPSKTWNNPSDLAVINSKVNFEIDLMVSEPETVAGVWINSGAKRLIIHIESTNKIEEIIQLANSRSVEVGIALNVDTENELLNEWISKVDFVQFMGIANIGYQGQGFDDRVLHKIEDLRSKYPNAIISVDGGVNLETAPLLIKAGVNRLATGSAVFQSSNIKDTIDKLQNGTS